MSFDTFANLKIEIIEWSHRNDVDQKIDDFIDLVEKDMFKSTGSHEALEIRGQETTSTASVSTKYFALPDEYFAFRSIRLVLDSTGGTLRFKTQDALLRRSGTGRPNYFSVGSQIEFDIAPDQAYTVEVNYYKKPTALSVSNQTNIVLDNHPEIYLNGALYYLFTYADDEAQANKYLQRYSEAINGANQADQEGRYGPAPYARIEGPTP